MRVKCKHNSGIEDRLTIGKDYGVLEETYNFYKIVDDTSEINCIIKERFEVVADIHELVFEEDTTGLKQYRYQPELY